MVDVFDYNKTGDVVTPSALVQKQVDSIPLLEGKILIPGAGIGSYIPALLDKGVKPFNIYAVEISPAYTHLGRGIFSRFGVNYVNTDFLTWNPQMQFDVIVGNPPYQGGNFGKKVYKSLWPLFWAKSFNLLKDDGFVSLITPLTWCSPTNDLSKKDAIEGETRLWEVFNKYTSVADVTTIKSYFPGVGSTFSLVSVDKSGSEGLAFTDGFVPTLGFYPLAGRDRVERELSLTKNIASECVISGRFEEGVRVSLIKSRKISEINVEVCQSMEKPKTDVPMSLYAHIYCKDTEEANFVRQRILDCTDVLYKHCRYNGFIDLKILGLVSMEKEG